MKALLLTLLLMPLSAQALPLLEWVSGPVNIGHTPIDQPVRYTTTDHSIHIFYASYQPARFAIRALFLEDVLVDVRLDSFGRGLQRRERGVEHCGGRGISPATGGWECPCSRSPALSQVGMST